MISTFTFGEIIYSAPAAAASFTLRLGHNRARADMQPTGERFAHHTDLLRRHCRRSLSGLVERNLHEVEAAAPKRIGDFYDFFRRCAADNRNKLFFAQKRTKIH
ncbi:MAG: hypothetical protein V8T01_06695 [Oscillospiraceae bacterium]